MKFPAYWLVIPPLIPITIVGILGIGELAGTQWNIHGGAAALLLLLAFSCFGLLFSGLIFVPIGLKLLVLDQAIRTRLNIAYFLFGSICWLIALSAIIYLAYSVITHQVQ